MGLKVPKVLMTVSFCNVTACGGATGCNPGVPTTHNSLQPRYVNTRLRSLVLTKRQHTLRRTNIVKKAVNYFARHSLTGTPSHFLNSAPLRNPSQAEKSPISEYPDHSPTRGWLSSGQLTVIAEKTHAGASAVGGQGSTLLHRLSLPRP